MTLPAVFTVSLVSLCYEVLLTRFFSFSQWYHLSFMVISIVLFGFGASGSLLCLIERRRPGFCTGVLGSPRFAALLLICSLAVSGSFFSVKLIPLDYFRMPLEWRQGLYILATFFILLIPFFTAGSVISLAFAASPNRSGWIYFSSMAGSALGALLPILLLPLLGEGGIVLCCALLPLPLACLETFAGRRPPWWIPSAAGLLLLLTCLPLFYRGGELLEITPSPYKLLPQVLQFPETSVTARSNTIRGRLHRLESPYIRFAPGLSLKYSGDLPAASFLVQDGDALFVRYDPKDERALQFCRYLHTYAGYSLRSQRRPDKVLILLQGGGLSLPCAVSAAAGEITLLVEHPLVADFYRTLPNLKVFSGNLRRRLDRDRVHYDRIQLEAWGPSVPGMASLNQEHLLTVEAFSAYLRRLKPEGILIVSRKLLLPPSDMLKVYAAAYSSLETSGVDDPGEHILLIRGWDSYTLLCSPSPFTATQIDRLRTFCRERNFDPVFYRGIEPGEANRFNSFAEAFHFREIQRLEQALQEGRGGKYFRKYYLDIAPARDDRPFHSHFSRLGKLKYLFRTTGSRFYTLLLSGETVVLAVLCIAVLLGIFLLLLPRLFSGHSPRQRSPSAVPYFLAAGAGFMFVEMAFLQGYTFVFGNPVIAITVVLAGLLVMSGIGGALSARWSERILRPLLGVVVLCILVIFLLHGRLQRHLLQAAGAGQVLGAFALLAPPALLMGVPFPVGLRLLVPSPRHRAFGWAANGVASVLASIVAVPLAMSWGISRLLLLAGICYALMLLLLIRRRAGGGGAEL